MKKQVYSVSLTQTKKKKGKYGGSKYATVLAKSFDHAAKKAEKEYPNYTSTNVTVEGKFIK